ncbi:MAG TPA: hypothetical protein VH325_09560, partial [Bryobacteraceae bacterium]|nr:hypothetical protein [Bryobacteraceae bacterium]
MQAYRSGQPLLAHEDPGEWKQLRDTYAAEYDPPTPFLEELMDEAARAHWFLKRTQTNLHLAQVDLAEDPRDWAAEDHQRMTLFLRYQTMAELSFNRALARLRSFHKDRRASEPAATEELAQDGRGRSAPRQELASSSTGSGARIRTLGASKAAKQSQSEPKIVEQWVEVRRIDNQPVTQFFPSNEEMEQRIES